MRNIRLIARLDIKGPNLIKGVHLEGLRVIGDPQLYTSRYYQQGIDEILYMDTVASLYQRNNLAEIVSLASRDVFVPITVGGGIRSLEDATHILRAGADKVAINTAVTKDPTLITNIARRFGSQCMVLSVEAKRRGPESWEAYTDNGREPTGRLVLDWVKEAVERGAGEILLTSVDQEGTRKGYDVELVSAVTAAVSVPVIASGGMGTIAHVLDVVQRGKADAVAVADVLHYDRMSVVGIRDEISKAGIPTRKICQL